MIVNARLTTDVLPSHIKLKEIHGIVESPYAIEISAKPLLRSIFERKRNEHDDAIELLKDSARAIGEGNVIYGLRISTAAAGFSNGTFLHMTYWALLQKMQLSRKALRSLLSSGLTL